MNEFRPEARGLTPEGRLAPAESWPSACSRVTFRVKPAGRDVW